MKGSLDRKLPSYGRLSWLAFPPSCPPHHHVNHIIMFTPSSCQPHHHHHHHHHHQVAGKCNRSEAYELRVKTLSGTKPYFFSYKVAFPWSPKYILCFRGCGPRSGKVADKKCTGQRGERNLQFKMLKNCILGTILEDEVAKCAQDWSERSICTSKLYKVQNWGVRSTFGRWGRKNVHQEVAKSRFHMKIAKNSNRPYKSAARKLVDLVRRSCYAGFQRAVTKRNGTAARRTA